MHRALGSNPAQPQRFRRGADLPLGADVVVVDEASMVDINVMRHLCEAVAMGPGRLILLGDPDQLTSVGAGSVLSDLVAAHQSGQSSLEQQIATLKTSHRFAQAASINCVATLLQTHQSDAIALAFDLFRAIASKDPRWRSQCLADPLEADGQPRRFVWQKTTTSALSSTQLDELATGYLARSQSQYPRRAPGPIWQILEAIDADEDLSDPHVQQRCLQSLHNYRVLCAHRNGPRGVQGINEALSARARALLGSRATMTPSGHWLGQPIMITRNADDLGLRNGDVGLILPNAQGSLCALFARNDEIEHISLAALPAHQSAFAMSIHKSQGSQFGHVAIVLPAKVGSAVCTRELIYTALTRAQHDVSWYGSEAVLKDALSKRASRNSALVSLLRLPTAT
ncbi:MAG TPA: hypothetical protein DCQ06_08735 [Myxococcales bacterium]|nr:hypothetical protein [Myxococcales bacterium]